MTIIKSKTNAKYVRILENHTEKTFMAFLCQPGQSVDTGEDLLDMKSYSTIEGAKRYAAKKLK